jgi:RNA polymerase sigma factor (sigma-70 family)
MSELSQAERYLLDQIRQGKQEGWSELVDRFQGRLLAFARSRGIGTSDADDLVQDTFIRFLNGLATYREEASLETYLFMILRRRIIDHLRVKKVNVCLVQDDADGGESSVLPIPSADLTASHYARNDEQAKLAGNALAGALGEMVGMLKQEENLRDLQIMEMLFYAQLRNKDIARLSGLDEKAIALIKHRWLKQLRERVVRRLIDQDLSALEENPASDSLLTEIWERQRLSCPKRSTVGGFLLKTLDKSWQEYVEFHVNQLGCRFCRANLDDLQSETKQAPRALREMIMQSTVGFFQK